MEMLKNRHNITIIGVYTPSENADKQIKDSFYNTLSDIITNIKSDNEIYVLGDLNGRVAKEEHNHIVEKYDELTTNENGLRLRNLCQNMPFIIMNGFFPHKDLHEYTWIQPTIGLRSIFDYII